MELWIDELYTSLNVFKVNKRGTAQLILFKVNSRNTRKRFRVNNKNIRKMSVTSFCCFVFDFEHISHLFLVVLLLTLNKTLNNHSTSVNILMLTLLSIMNTFSTRFSSCKPIFVQSQQLKHQNHACNLFKVNI